MKNKLQLTSVKVMPQEYKKFKIKCLDTGLTLQELVNRSLFLYNRNGGYDKMIHETMILGISGSII